MKLGSRSIHGMCLFHPKVSTPVIGQFLGERCYCLAVVSFVVLSVPMVPHNTPVYWGQQCLQPWPWHLYSPNLIFNKSSLWRRWYSGALPFISWPKWSGNVLILTWSNFVNLDRHSKLQEENSHGPQLLAKSPATILTVGGGGISQQYAPSTSQHQSSDPLNYNRKRKERPASCLLLFSTFSKQPSGFWGGMEQEEENNLGSHTMPERDGKHNRATI